MQAKYAARFVAFCKDEKAPGQLLDVSYMSYGVEIRRSKLTT